MSTLTANAPSVKPAPAIENPRDSWPAWTDADRWELGPQYDESRPTAGPHFIPTAEEETEAAELLNADDEPTDAEWDARAEEALAMDRVCSGCYVF